MKKHYGFYTLTFLVIANMIGAGVFTTSGYTLADLNSPWIVILAWIVGGIIAISGAISYGLLSRLMPESGGEYLFLTHAAHPLLGYIAGWVSLVAGFSGAIALAAVALESYLIPASVRPAGLPMGVIAIAAIIISSLMHGFRPVLGAFMQNTVVVTKLMLLIVIVTVGGYLVLQQGGAHRFMPSNTAEAIVETDLAINEQDSASVLGADPLRMIFLFAGSLVWISLSYSGFNAAVYVASEVNDPQRVIPRALVTGTLMVVVGYVLLNAIFVLGAPYDAIAGQENVAAIAAGELGGIWFEEFVRWTIVLCLLTSVFSMMMAAPRVYAKMADDGLLPRMLSFQGDQPLNATAVQAVIAIGLVLVSDLQGLIMYLGLTLSLSAACSVACLFLPASRRKLSEQSSPLNRLWYLPPAFYVIATTVAAAMLTYMDPYQALGTLFTFSIGTLAYFVSLYQRR